jgi:photosystem II stability/assembly factor-like uncharacterized protein
MSCRVLVLVAAVGMTGGSPAADDEVFNSMSYRLVGPFRGGRVTAVTGVPGDPMTYYMGATGGGVWKTTDAGETWRNVSDVVRELEPKPEPQVMGDVDPVMAEYGVLRPPAEGLPLEGVGARRVRRGGDAFGSGSIGAIAVAPSDPNVVYVGTGSACIRGNVSPGVGVYKSTDAGGTWRFMGLPEAGQIGAVIVHPTDPDVVYVAALGHAFGPNEERGVYRSTNGGLTWTKVLYVSDEAGAVDLSMDPSNPRVLYAAMWQAMRQPWTMTSGGPGGGLYKTTDGGNTWTELEEGLPDGDKGRIAVAVSPAEPRRVWALVEHEEGGLFRSDDGGEKFRLVTADRELRQRAWYYTHVEADPVDVNTVYVLNVLFWRSDDGGKSFRPVRTPHGDNHDLWINPDDPSNMIEGNDGGANVTFNGGRTWTSQANQPTSEMYRVTVDDQHPYWLYGGQQDNTAVAIPSRTADGNIDREHWYAPAGCESATVAVDPRNPNVTYGGCYGGTISRYDRELGLAEEVMTWPQMAVGQQAVDLRYRFQWNAPIKISPHDPSVLYHCSNYVHRTADGGQTWQVISPDLTRDDQSKQGYAGGPITRDNTGVEVYGTIFAFEESPHRAGLLWAGSDDGLVHISEDGGDNWRDITPRGMPEWGTVNNIELSAHDPGRAFIAVHRYRLDDFRPYIFRTDDFGTRWRLLTGGDNGIPADHFVRAVREDPERRGLLYAGTEFGMYVSLDDGASWRSLQLDLPVTPITDLAVKRGDLVVATQGRSYWILDDLSPLRQLTPEVEEAELHLFEPRPAVRWIDGAGSFARGPVGENPPFGAVIHYVLPDGLDDEDADEVTLEILDSDDEVLRTLSSKTPEPQAPSIFRKFFPELVEPPLLDARSGANRYVWNLRLADPELTDDAVVWGWTVGPLVPPGTYRARLTVGDWSDTASVEVVHDPRTGISQEALEEQFELARSSWELLTRTHDTVRKIRDVRDQTTGMAARMKDEAVQEKVDQLSKALTEIEEQLHQTKLESSQDVLNYPPQLDNQLVFLQSVVESAAGRPTVGSKERFQELQAELVRLETELDNVLETRLPEIERLLEEAGTPRIVLEPAEEEEDSKEGRFRFSTGP